jgi:hypothetical protein
MLAVVSYSLRDCMKACASFNLNADNSGRDSGGPERCARVVFNANLTVVVRDNFGTCFLKNSTSNLLPGSGDVNFYAGAAVVWDFLNRQIGCPK